MALRQTTLRRLIALRRFAKARQCCTRMLRGEAGALGYGCAANNSFCVTHTRGDQHGMLAGS
jgi:hypothetical protein